MSDAAKVLMGHCPQCRKPSVIAPSNPWRPFCSERCKLVDLGDWMSGRFAIPVEEPDGFEDETDQLPRRSSEHQ